MPMRWLRPISALTMYLSPFVPLTGCADLADTYVERQEKVALVSLQEGLGRFAGAELESALTVEIAVAEFLAEEPATRGSPS